jgi:hypothetical protein
MGVWLLGRLGLRIRRRYDISSELAVLVLVSRAERKGTDRWVGA